MRTYVVTIFLSAFLLFQVEPMIARFILPWFGGTPGVWTTCLLFFQVLLLAGYAYAHLIGTRLDARRQTIVHLGIVATCIAAMAAAAIAWKSPMMPAGFWKPSTPNFPIPRILAMLTVSVGLPYFALSATAPLLQEWFSRTYRGVSPYRLYAVSNLGSLVALLTYPFAVEPTLALGTQADLWSLLYAAFAAGMALCALRLIGSAPGAEPDRDGAAATKRAGAGDRAMWLALPACAAFLLYSGTTELTQDTAPIPFLWILPLALYLLSFIICFDSGRWYRRGIFHPMLAIAIVASFIVVAYEGEISTAIGSVMLSPTRVILIVEIWSVALLVFAGCMVCHGELVRLKPDHRDLTRFYLMVSAGGAIGGVMSVIVAPLIFRGFWDFRIAVWASAALMTLALMRDRRSWLYDRAPAAAIAIVAAALVFPLAIRVVRHPRAYAGGLLALVAGAALARRRGLALRAAARPGIFMELAMGAALAVLAIVYFQTTRLAMHDTVAMERNFYGTFRVVADEAADNSWRSYRLMNGRITHGKQFFSKEYSRMRYYPTGYYGIRSGLGLLMMNYPRGEAHDSPIRIGAIGLGVGAISAWGRPGDYIRFYELNPAIITAATDAAGYFTYVRDSPAKVDIVPGDARLSMERELAQGNPQNFDVLVIDAFNGDSVPIHLLTREAMSIYLKSLKPDGVIAVHISNLYLDLRPVLAELSRAYGLKYGYVHTDEKDLVDWESDWVILDRGGKVITRPAIASEIRPPDGLPRIRPWTDDYSTLLPLLK